MKYHVYTEVDKKHEASKPSAVFAKLFRSSSNVFQISQFPSYTMVKFLAVRANQLIFPSKYHYMLYMTASLELSCGKQLVFQNSKVIVSRPHESYSRRSRQVIRCMSRLPFISRCVVYTMRPSFLFVP